MIETLSKCYAIEQWVDIKGYEGLYGISNLGNIFSCRADRNLKPQKTNRGYLRICLSVNDSKKFISVHRLVASAWVFNPGLKPQVNHIDGDKTNNKAKNLEWCTQVENSAHSYNTGLQQKKYGEDVSSAKLSNDQVREIKSRLMLYKKGDCKRIAEEYGVTRQNIEYIKNGKSRCNEIIEENSEGE